MSRSGVGCNRLDRPMQRKPLLAAALLLVFCMGLAVLGCRDEIEQVSEETAPASAVAQSSSVDQRKQQSSSAGVTQPSDEAAERPTARQEQQEAMQQEQAEQAEVEYEEAAEEEEAAVAEEAEEESLADEGERSETGTNIQVVGVDEPDVIKTDGERFYVLDSERLSIISIADGGLELIGELAFDPPGSVHLLGHQQLLLAGDTLLALRTIGFDINEFWNRWNTQARWVWANWWWYFRGETMLAEQVQQEPWTQLVEIDISDPSNPWIRRTLEVEADLLGARLVDASARILLRSDDFELLDEDTIVPSIDLCEYESAATSVVGQCPDRVTRQMIDPEALRDRSGFRAFDAIVVLLTFDLSESGQGLGRWGSVTAGTEGRDATVYATVNSLYVAQLDFDYGRTEIHRFDLGDPMSPRQAGSEIARGRLINQFALSEFRGHLRVATTIEDTWPTESVITVFELSETSMRWVTSLNGLGTTELIHAVRFMGERAFVVTFRQIDPLYVIDLSDPLEPFVAGELKLPGFSRYLHPLGGGRLIGVGQDADPSTGWPLGLQLSLFDVSDSNNPKVIHQLKPETSYHGDGRYVQGWPEIDHRSFTYHRGVAYVPALLVNEGNWIGSGRVYAIAVSCEELTLLEAFGGEPGLFPVRVIPLAERLYVLSWGEDSFLVQQLSLPSRPVPQGQFREQDRIWVRSGGAVEHAGDPSDCG